MVDADSHWCTCAYCRNVHPQLPDILGPEVRELLRRLGVDPLKPSEAVHYGRQKDGSNLYSVWFIILSASLTRASRCARLQCHEAARAS
jgi:hypothetical protein